MVSGAGRPRPLRRVGPRRTATPRASTQGAGVGRLGGGARGAIKQGLAAANAARRGCAAGDLGRPRSGHTHTQEGESTATPRLWPQKNLPAPLSPGRQPSTATPLRPPHPDEDVAR